MNYTFLRNQTKTKDYLFIFVRLIVKITTDDESGLEDIRGCSNDEDEELSKEELEKSHRFLEKSEKE